MKAYVIASSLFLWSLQRKVNALIEKGYEPCGGVSRGWGGLTQAMRLK